MLGIVVIASVSSVAALRLDKSPNYFWIYQVLYAVFALTTVLIIRMIDYRWYSRTWVMILLALLVLAGLVSVFIPGISAGCINGAYRWVRCAGVRIQPSEFIKVIIILLTAAWAGKVSRRLDRFWEGLFPLGMALGIVAFGLLRQPDLGSTFMVGISVLAVMFVAGLKFWPFLLIAGGGAVGLVIKILNNPNSLERFKPGEQVNQSLAALATAGWKGLGYGNSIRKERFLPENHTDFILTMIGEELGLIATILVVLAYACILIAGLIVVLRAHDKFGKLLAFGLTFYLCFAAAFNMAVVTNLAPTKGIALPFLSYGGSSMVASMLAIGLILSVARINEEEKRSLATGNVYL